MRIIPQLKNDLRKYLFEKIRTENKAVTVASSYALGAEETSLLQSKLPLLDLKTAKFIIDPSIIAGVVISVGSRVINLSLKKSLSNLKHLIYESY